MVEALGHLLALGPDEAELAHVIQKGFGGCNDDLWIPQIAAEGGVLITSDRGKKPRPGKGKKLPQVCREQHVTYAALSASLAQSKGIVKVSAILTVLDNIMSDVVSAPKGTGFSIYVGPSGHALLVEQWPAPGD